MLWIDVSVGDVVDLDDGKIKVYFNKQKGDGKAKIGFEADKSVSINLKQKENTIVNGLTLKTVKK